MKLVFSGIENPPVFISDSICPQKLNPVFYKNPISKCPKSLNKFMNKTK